MHSIKNDMVAQSSDSKFIDKIQTRPIFLYLISLLILAIIAVIVAFNYIGYVRSFVIEEQQKYTLTKMMNLAQKSISPTLSQFRQGDITKNAALTQIETTLGSIDDPKNNSFYLFSPKGNILLPKPANSSLPILSNSNLLQQVQTTTESITEATFISYSYKDNSQEEFLYLYPIPELDCILGVVDSDANDNGNFPQVIVQVPLITIGLTLLFSIPIFLSVRRIYQNQNILENEIEERKKYSRQAEALARCASHLNSKLDLRNVSEAVCEEAALTLGVPIALVQLYDETTDDYQFMTTYGVPKDIQECAESILRKTIRINRHSQNEDRLSIIPDISNYPTVYQSLCEQLNIKTMVSVKLFHESEVIGYLNVFSTQNIRNFREDELALLETLSDYMSISIYNARLFEQIKAGRERMKMLSQKLVETQETERRHLARELHDEIGQTLTHIKMSLDQILLSNDHPYKEALVKSQNLAQELMNQIRALSLDLRPTILDDLGLLPALLWHFDRYTTQTGIKVNFKYNNLDQRFPANIETTAYRVLQEALTNVARYSGQKEVSVYAWADENNLGVQVIDEGSGFDVEQTLTHKETGGLSGMQERASLCNGHLLIESAPGEGTSITLNIPLDGNYLERRKHDRNNHSG